MKYIYLGAETGVKTSALALKYGYEERPHEQFNHSRSQVVYPEIPHINWDVMLIRETVRDGLYECVLSYDESRHLVQSGLVKTGNSSEIKIR